MSPPTWVSRDTVWDCQPRLPRNGQRGGWCKRGVHVGQSSESNIFFASLMTKESKEWLKMISILVTIGTSSLLSSPRQCHVWELFYSVVLVPHLRLGRGTPADPDEWRRPPPVVVLPVGCWPGMVSLWGGVRKGVRVGGGMIESCIDCLCVGWCVEDML